MRAAKKLTEQKIEDRSLTWRKLQARQRSLHAFLHSLEYGLLGMVTQSVQCS